MTSEQSEISRLEQANLLSLKFFQTVIVLNGGAFLALFAYLTNSKADAAVFVELACIKIAMVSLLASIIVILCSLLISYAFIASSPETRLSRYFNQWIILWNFVFAVLALVGFAFGIAVLILGAQTR